MSLLRQALQDLGTLLLPEIVTIADIGCSSGPDTTLFAITEITSAISERCRELGRATPEFLVYLNDLHAIDFNRVFKCLPDFNKKMQEQHGPIYICGVPGSFYGRIFPTQSLHFVHCSSSLHWLSQVPPEFCDKVNPLINKGKIFISKTSPPSVIDAYKYQFERDFSFLKSRSKEVVSGGRMVFSLKARRTDDPTPDESCLLWDYLGEAFQDLVAECCNTGLIEEKKFDTYNTPYYEPYTEDVKAEIKKEGSFILDHLKITAIPWDGANGGNKYDRTKTAEIMGKMIRAFNESVIHSHFGSEIMDRLFQRFTEIVAADTKEVEHIGALFSLIRKSH
ncbi:hypothetical protein Pint_28524 [Pistacia integerrima]|uniref:Uncharacterized protein n=1 Tax=Pistacia integerrima TaxID=434235 RepID=A0ACC0YVK5_9ROSI|nr:hypothetical protein Pint_28524 [Pistacia integerrima]